MLTRKLVKAGPSSHTIALPKEWIEKNSLKKGDVVYVSHKDDELRILARIGDQQNKIERETIIDVSQKGLDSVQRLLTSAYLNNFSTIVLTGEDIDKKMAEIRTIVADFVALEITDQSSKRVVIKDLLNPSEVSVDKTLKRMDMIVRSMFEDLLSKPKQELHFQDKDVNRLYFLMLRALKSALRSDDIAKQLQIVPVGVLSVWQTVTCIENISDSLTHVSSIMRGLKTRDKVSDKVIEQVVRSVGTLFADVMGSYYQGDSVKGDVFAKKRLEIESQLNDVEGTREIGEIVQETKTMLTHVCTIAKVVIDRE